MPYHPHRKENATPLSSPSARIHPIVRSFASAIAPRRRIIDIGAGKGLVAREMAQQFDARVTMVDVAQYNQTDLPLAVCDSRALAFADRSFDYGILSFVLHHCENPKEILSEALRVASRVIVIENDVRGPVRGLLTRLIDSWPAIQYGTPPCYFAQSRDAWLKLFGQFPVEARVLGEFTLEYGFFRCFTVELRGK
jgi:ubiquinone/menaquinone biosynthesis C-methylase UbiE